MMSWNNLHAILYGGIFSSMLLFDPETTPPPPRHHYPQNPELSVRDLMTFCSIVLDVLVVD